VRSMRRLAAWLLCLCLLCGIPLSVDAANDITMQKAEITKVTDSHIVVRVTFSDKIRLWSTLQNRDHNLFCLQSQADAFGCSTTANTPWQMWQHTTAYINGETIDDKVYSDVLELTFPYCAHANHKALWFDADGIPQMPTGAYLYLADNGKNPDGSEYLSADLITGVGGARVRRTDTGNNFNITRMPTVNSIEHPLTLYKAAVVAADENGYTVEATFSAPVHLNKDFWVMSSPIQDGCSETLCQCWKVLGVDYVDDTDNDGYASVVRISFDYCMNATYRADHRALWLDENGNYKVPDSGIFADGAYLFMSDLGGNHVKGSGMMSTSAISGLDGAAVVATNIENKGADNEYGELYATLVNEIPIEMTKAAVTDISSTGVTVKATFSAPVRLIQRQYSKFCLVPTSAGGGCSASNWQMWVHTDVNYLNPKQNAAGEDYSTELSMTFSYCTCANAAAHKALWVNEDGSFSMPESVWLYLDDSAQAVAADSGYLSKDLIRGIDGQPIARMSHGTTSKNTITSRVHMQAIDDRNGTGGVEIGEPFEADESTTYSFMNADTGREIAVNGVSEFRLAGQGHNKYTIRSGESYLDLTGSAPALSPNEIVYIIRPAAHERYQIISSTSSIIDTDGGTDGAVTLGKTAESNPIIASGWYLTKAGENKPLRILPFGDSITYGIGDDTKWGWRDNLSKDLATKLERYVFVGSQTNGITTTLAQAELARHEGNPGWTIQDLPTANNGSRVEGIYDLADGLVAKYAPDITLMMIGTNNLYWAARNDAEKKVEAEDIEQMLADYEQLIAALTFANDRQTIFCSTITPTTSGTIQGQETLFNAQFPAFIQKMAQTYPVVLNDNYGALMDENLADCLTDGTHLTEAGNVLLSQAYADSIASIYNTDGTKKSIAVRLDGAQGVVYLNADATVDGALTVPAGAVLDLNGHTLWADSVTVFGAVMDSTQGEGLIAGTAEELRFRDHTATNNGVMPLYDSQAQGYRLFDLTIKHATKTVDGVVKFGTALALGGDEFNATAYTLLKDSANANVILTFELSIDGGEVIYYDVNADVLTDYADRLLADHSKLHSTAIVLTVYGVEKMTDGMTLSCSPVLRSGTLVQTVGSTKEYVHSADFIR